jgi:CCDC81-like prokaryotic HU domain 1/CCDC81-like prokaryotic HU domain 2
MNLAVFIEELLWEHDCVIVPGWGGFITNYQSAKINPISHEIKPPSRQLSFNKHLQQQDGLLQSHVAKMAGIPMQNAQEMIQNWVRQNLSSLHNGERILMPNLGLFSLDMNGQVQFIPYEQASFLKSSFGLSPVLLQVAQPHKLIKSEGNTENGGIRKWVMAASIALALGLGAFGVQRSISKTDFAGWGANTNESAQYAPVLYPTPLPTVEKSSNEDLRLLAENLEQSQVAKRATSLPIPIQENQTAQPITTPKVIEKTKPVVKKNEVPSNTKKTWIVGGVFVSKENAQNKLQEMKAQGFRNAKMVILQDRYYTIYGEASTVKEEIQLRNQAAQVDPYAWTKR